MQVRTFVAAPVHDPALIRALAAAQQQLRRAGGRVRWVPEHQFHFTLKFLGEVEASRLATIRTAVSRAVGGKAPFSVVLSGVGAFPGLQAARVIWAGCGDGREPLLALARDVESELVKAGFAPERRGFSPHLTLGRVADGGLKAELATATGAQSGRVFGHQRVTEVVLFRSDLQPGGPVYTALERIPLVAAE